MIELEYWQLLFFPLFFAIGWGAARIDIRHLVKESRSLPRSYLQGLNFLLNDQQDRAVEAFVDAVKLDSQTVELQFALGSLLRRRGEIDRAIQMHEGLTSREDLSVAQRLQATLELGKDFLKAGILDRAESVFSRLRTSELAEEAKQNLLEIFQQEKEWAKAIEIAQELPDIATQRVIAQFYCELAYSEMHRSQWDSANEYINKALECNRQCVRATLLQGEVAFATGLYGEAVRLWQKIEQQNPAYLALAGQRFVAAFEKQKKKPEGLFLLRGFLSQYHSLDLLDSVFQLCLETEGAESAYKMVREELRKNPTLLGFDRLLQARVLTATAEVRPDLDLAKSIVHEYTRRLARFRCQSCGFKARQYYWRCPACGEWESYSPKRAEEIELTP